MLITPLPHIASLQQICVLQASHIYRFNLPMLHQHDLTTNQFDYSY